MALPRRLAGVGCVLPDSLPMAIPHTNGPHGIRLPRGPFVLLRASLAVSPNATRWVGLPTAAALAAFEQSPTRSTSGVLWGVGVRTTDFRCGAEADTLVW